MRRRGINYELDLCELSKWYVCWGFEMDGLDDCLALCEPGMTVIDVGAHVGFWTLPLAQKVGPGGLVHAVEPDPVNRRKLQRHLDLNPQVGCTIVHPVAISDTRETLHLASSIPHNRTRGSAMSEPKSRRSRSMIWALSQM